MNSPNVIQKGTVKALCCDFVHSDKNEQPTNSDKIIIFSRTRSAEVALCQMLTDGTPKKKVSTKFVKRDEGILSLKFAANLFVSFERLLSILEQMLHRETRFLISRAWVVVGISLLELPYEAR